MTIPVGPLLQASSGPPPTETASCNAYCDPRVSSSGLGSLTHFLPLTSFPSLCSNLTGLSLLLTQHLADSIFSSAQNDFLSSSLNFSSLLKCRSPCELTIPCKLLSAHPAPASIPHHHPSLLCFCPCDLCFVLFVQFFTASLPIFVVISKEARILVCLVCS